MGTCLTLHEQPRSLILRPYRCHPSLLLTRSSSVGWEVNEWWWMGRIGFGDELSQTWPMRSTIEAIDVRKMFSRDATVAISIQARWWCGGGLVLAVTNEDVDACCSSLAGSCRRRRIRMARDARDVRQGRAIRVGCFGLKSHSDLLNCSTHEIRHHMR